MSLWLYSSTIRISCLLKHRTENTWRHNAKKWNPAQSLHKLHIAPLSQKNQINRKELLFASLCQLISEPPVAAVISHHELLQLEQVLPPLISMKQLEIKPVKMNTKNKQAFTPGLLASQPQKSTELTAYYRVSLLQYRLHKGCVFISIVIKQLLLPWGNRRGVSRLRSAPHPGLSGNRWRWVGDLQLSAALPESPPARGLRRPGFDALSTTKERFKHIMKTVGTFMALFPQ